LFPTKIIGTFGQKCRTLIYIDYLYLSQFLKYLRGPFLSYIFKRIRRINAKNKIFNKNLRNQFIPKAHKDYISIRIAQWAQSVVILLSSCIPQSKFNLNKEFNKMESFNLPLINFNISYIIFKNCRDINFRKIIFTKYLNKDLINLIPKQGFNHPSFNNKKQTIKRHVFPQAPSPTITSFRRIVAIFQALNFVKVKIKLKFFKKMSKNL
jgi:hypothetical protein